VVAGAHQEDSMKSISKMGMVVVAGLFVTHAASAEELNEAGHFSVGVERLFGVGYTTATVSQNGVESTASETSISLLTKPIASPVAAPRIAFDYFVTNGLSLGIGLGYSTMAIDTKLSGNTGGISISPIGAGIHTFLVAPRVGYAYMFNEHVGLWPRAGVTYTWASTDTEGSSDSVSQHSLAVSAEVPLVLSPVPHVAFLLAPTIDYGVSAGTTNHTANMPDRTIDYNPLDIGFHAGVALWF
jgi:hypothetical protein